MSSKKIVALALSILVASMFLSLVSASPGDGISSYNPIPEVSPTPTPDPNATATPHPTAPPSNGSYIGAYAIQNINPNGAPLQLSSYNQTIVSLVFANALSCTANVTTMGHWRDNRDSSGSMTLFPDDIGTYEIHYQVLYDRSVSQSVTLTVYSGDNSPPNVLPIESNNNMGFTLDLVLTVMELPHFPSASEIAQAQSDVTNQLIGNMSSAYQNALAESSIRANASLVIAVVAAVVFGVLIFLVIRHQRHRDAQIIGLNARGFGDGKA